MQFSFKVVGESADRPALEAAFEKAGVEYDIQNAQGDPAQMQTIADQMITEGVSVLAIVNLDSDSVRRSRTRPPTPALPRSTTTG